MYGSWFLEYGARQTEFFVILGHFLSLYPSNDQQNQNFEKMKKNILEIGQGKKLFPSDWVSKKSHPGGRKKKLFFFVI